MRHVKLKIDCQSIVHAAFFPKLYSPSEHEQAVKAMAVARGRGLTKVGENIGVQPLERAEKQCEDRVVNVEEPCEEEAMDLSLKKVGKHCEQTKETVGAASVTTADMTALADMSEMAGEVIN